MPDAITPVDWEQRLTDITRAWTDYRADPLDTEAYERTQALSRQEWDLGQLEPTVAFIETGTIRVTKRHRVYEDRNGNCREWESVSGNGSATVTLSREEVIQHARSASRSTTRQIQDSLTASLGIGLGAGETGTIEAGLTSQLQSSRASTVLSSESISVAISSAISRSEVLQINDPPSCHTVEVPYGLRVAVHLSGRMTLSRRWFQQGGGPPFTLRWAESLDEITLNANARVIVEPHLQESEMTLTPSACQHCPDEAGAHSEVPDEGETPAGQSVPPRRSGSRVRRVSRRPVTDIEGVGDTYAARLAGAGIVDVGDLLTKPVPLSKIDVSTEVVEHWRDMAEWIGTFPDLDGNDAQVLVEGLRIKTPRSLTIHSLPSPRAVHYAALRIRAPKGHRPERVVKALTRHACRCLG